MSVKQLEKTEWRPFFDYLSKSLEGRQAEIEAAALSIGNQVQANWLTILGLAYDPKDDVVELALGGLDHLIKKPSTIFFDEEAGMLGSLEIVDADNISQVVKFREPLALPAQH